MVKPKVVLLFSLLPSLFVFDILKKEEKEKTNDKNGKEPAESEGTKVSHEIRDDTLNNQTHTDGKKTKKNKTKYRRDGPTLKTLMWYTK